MNILDVDVSRNNDENAEVCGHGIEKDKYRNYEYVLVVPQKLTKHAQNVIYSRQATPLRYHLEGRFGSRTHRIDESHMGLPLTSLLSLDESRARIEKAATLYEDLRALVSTEGVKFCYKPYFEPASNRARPPPYIDARIHPEREPNGRGDNEFWTRMMKALRSQSAGIPVKQFNPRIQTAATIHHFNHFSLRKERKLFTYAELFAGMGGFGIALDALGGKCIFMSELEEHLRKLYHHNFVTLPSNFQKQMHDDAKLVNSEIPIHGDIYKVPDTSFPVDTLDLLVGGFPCQPFSALGEQPGLNCPKAGNLFLEIVRVLRVSKPKAFLLENVPGLVSMEDTFKTIVSALGNEGYNVTFEVCSARGLTVTGRKRLFLVGLRRAKGGIGTEQCLQPEKFEFPFVPDLGLMFRDVLDYDNLPKEELNILRLSEDTFDQLLNNKRWRPSRLAWPNTKGDTLTSHYGNSVGRGESQLVPCKAPCLPRRLSVREMARMMGFPNSYEFLPPRPRQSPMAYRKEVSSSAKQGDFFLSHYDCQPVVALMIFLFRKQYRAIGNAVCPPLIAALAGAILDRCPGLVARDHNWLFRGQEIAVHLAMAAIRPKPANVPRGCLLPSERSLHE